MFFGVQPSRAQLSDTNEHLVRTLRAIAQDPDRVIDAVWRWSNTRECYERVKRMRPQSAVGAAARFVYLNRTAWGGMYRVNVKGEFNVPFGNSGRVMLHRKQVLECAELLRHATVVPGDFEPAIESASAGDVVYADPPYVQQELSGEVVFNRYGSERFGLADEKRLAYAAEEARKRGAFVCVSSFWTERTEALWSGWTAVEVRRPSNVSRKAAGRRTVSEVVILSDQPRSAFDSVFQI
jgi:DNA adenine methylase